MEKRHKHVSPTLDIMVKKIFSLPEATVAMEKFVCLIIQLTTKRRLLAMPQ